ncbi:hypothetical protein GCM10020254_51640 [Streptomyces goshikiensis]
MGLDVPSLGTAAQAGAPRYGRTLLQPPAKVPPQTTTVARNTVPAPDSSGFSPAGTKTDSPGGQGQFTGPGAARRAEQDLRGSGRQDAGLAAGREDEPGEPELVRGGLVDLLGIALGAQHGRVARLEPHDLQQFRYVNVLGGEPGAQHVVGVGEQFDAEAVEVGVRDARAEEHGLAGLEFDVVEQHGGDHPGIAGVLVDERGVRLVRAAEPYGGVPGLVDRTGHLRAVAAQDGGEHLPQRRLLGVGVQQVHVRLEGVDVEAVEEGRGLQGPAESAQPAEGGERADQLGLVVGVLVVAVTGVHGDAARLLVGEAGARLGQVGVDLEGERGAGGEELEEEGQPGGRTWRRPPRRVRARGRRR